MKRRRISLLCPLGFIALVAVLLRFVFEPIYRQAEWSRLNRNIAIKLGNLDRLNMSESASGSFFHWSAARGWVETAYSNVCFSQECVSVAEMKRFDSDLDLKLKGRADFATLEWVWNRLGETGPHGKQYTERFAPSFREALPQADSPGGSWPEAWSY